MQFIIDKYLKGDKVIWAIIILLSLFSIVMAYSSSSNLAYRLMDGNATPYLIKHTFVIVIGILVIIYLQFFNYKYFSRISQLGIYVSVVLLLVTLLFGVNKGNASRWIMGFQPSDFAKVMLVLYVSRMLVVKKNELGNFKKGLIPILWPVFLVCSLIFPADFSTAALLFTVCFILIFVAGAKIKHLLSIIGGVIAMISLLLVINMLFAGLLPRVDTWTSRVVNYNSGDPQENYQAEMAKRAVATGYLQGKGPGNGIVKNNLYSAQSDFIYSSSIEEFGSILGGVGLILLYLILLFRAVKIMTKAENKFGGYIAFGLGFMLVFQALINMSVGVSLIPVTGQPLPLISMGGTSILFTCMSIGIILNVSRTVYKENES